MRFGRLIGELETSVRHFFEESWNSDSPVSTNFQFLEFVKTGDRWERMKKSLKTSMLKAPTSGPLKRNSFRESQDFWKNG